MKDLIERQAAIRIASGYCHPANVAKELAKLPSVQPEIIRCRDCKWQKDQSGSTAWLPCRALVTPPDFYCGRAERRTDERDKT